MKRYLPYDVKTLLQSLGLLVAVAVGMRYGGGIAFVALVVPPALMAMARRRADKVLFYILLATAVLMANARLVPKDSLFGLAQRGLLVIMGLVLLLQLNGVRISRLTKPLLGVFPYIAFMALPSALGWNPKISFLKIILFVLIYIAYFGATNQVAMSWRIKVERLRASILAIAVFFLIGSFLLIPFPAYSQMTDAEAMLSSNVSSLFMGMTSQSQALGPVVSALAVIVLSDLLFSIRRPDKLYLALLAVSPILIYKTSSRTGMGAFLLGMVYVVFLFVKARGIQSRWRSRVLSCAMLLGTCAVMFFCLSPGVRAAATRYMLKWTNDDSGRVSKEGVMSSRQGMIDKAMYNFRKSPVIGNGFQVAEDMADLKSSGLILSAPIEKGVWVAAVLEEGGLVGFMLFAGFLFFAIITLAKRGAPTGSACLFVCMLTNFGEFTFFSMTYMGGFIWAMVFAGVAMDAQRIKQQNAQRMVMTRFM